MFHCVNNI